MTKIIAVDVGYGDTKAVSTDGARVLYPSVWAPARDLIQNRSMNGDGHIVEITHLQDARRSSSFVGEMALRESKTVSFTMDREKHLHPSHDILLLTAVALLAETTCPGPITLGVGLPIDCYKSQSDALVNHIMGLKVAVKVDRERPVEITFNKVTAYLQGVTALLCVRDKPSNGLVALIDPGYKTTDYTVFEMKNGRPHLISDLSGSVNIGVSQVNETISKRFMEITGGVLDSWRIKSLVRDGKVIYEGRTYDLTEMMTTATTDVSRTITDKVREAWRDLAKFIIRTYMIGGVVLLTDLPRLMPLAEVIPNPRFANAESYLDMLMGVQPAA